MAETGFQTSARTALDRVLAAHDIAVPAWEERRDGLLRMQGNFEAYGRTHEVYIYHDQITMTSGQQLFENYLTHEFETDEAHIAAFATRLDRYLTSREWAGENEPGPFDEFRSATSALLSAALSFFKMR